MGRDLLKEGCVARALAFLFAAAVFAPGCAPLPPTRAEQMLRVVSYNIRSGNGDLARTAETIRGFAADIVALQEVDVHWSSRSAFADQAADLGKRLNMRALFARIYDLPATDSASPRRQFGVALLTRFPVAQWTNDTLTRLSTQVQTPAPERMPGMVDARLDIGGQTIRVLNTHLDYRADPQVRRTQVDEMVGYIGAPALPTIVFGDLNAKPDAPELQPLFARLRDAWNAQNGASTASAANPAARGDGFTYPAENPTARIDYVLVSQHFRVRSATVPNTLASDHRPVVAELILKGAK
jgi:endonuclease/exonuclease/phosphatase family metal-dependent hydrolase